MNVVWEPKKNEWLMLNRGISFEEITDKILNEEYVDIIENPSRNDQQCFILMIEDYIWVIPFVLDAEENIVLKTAYPSRKMNKRYGVE